jgi:mannose-6-phosphate isomerase
MTTLPPLRLGPTFERRLWGGDTLAVWLGEPAPPGDEPVAEAWLAHGESRVRGGRYDEARLDDLARRYGADLVGTAPLARYGPRMPLLVKFLDAADDLSVQVHPDDETAARRHPGSGSLGKTESWRILGAEPGARIVWGFRATVTDEQVRAALADERLGDLLRHVPVRAGQVVHNPAGTVHAVGAGLRLYELQQASDLTYRLWDYGRRGADGRRRELHVDAALAVADLSGGGEPTRTSRPGPDGWSERVACPFYRLEEARLDGGLEATTDPSALHLLTVLEGEAEVHADDARVAMPEGATTLIPAVTGGYRLTGRATLLRGRPVAASD